MAGDWKLYHYTPSLAAAVIFIILFLIVTVWHIFIMFRRKAWFFVPFVIGCICEVIGYVGRALGHNDPQSIAFYVIQSCLLLIAPALMAASLYMVFGRFILLLQADHLSVIRSSWLTKIFVIGDVFSLLIQVGGAGMVSDPKKANIVKATILAGLFIQIAFFGLFIICTGILHYRLLKFPTSMSIQLHPQSPHGGWRRVVYLLYGVGLTIFVRSVFRVAEFGTGSDGAIQQHEVLLYIFDGTLMFLVTVAVGIWHPSKVVPGRKEILRIHSTYADPAATNMTPYYKVDNNHNAA